MMTAHTANSAEHYFDPAICPQQYPMQLTFEGQYVHRAPTSRLPLLAGDVDYTLYSTPERLALATSSANFLAPHFTSTSAASSIHPHHDIYSPYMTSISASHRVQSSAALAAKAITKRSGNCTQTSSGQVAYSHCMTQSHAKRLPDPSMAYAQLPDRATLLNTFVNADNLATTYGYFVGYCFPEVEGWVRAKAAERFFKFVRRVPKPNKRLSIPLEVLFETWKKYRRGIFIASKDPWEAAIGSIPRMPSRNLPIYSVALMDWIKAWHLDAYFDWLLDVSQVPTASYYTQRGENNDAFTRVLSLGLSYAFSNGAANDCYAWPPTADLKPIDQVAAMYAVISTTFTASRTQQTTSPRRSRAG